MGNAEKSWYIGLIFIVLISLSFRIFEYFNGVPIKFDDFLDSIIFIAVLMYPYINNYSVKKKVEKLKEELHIENDLTFDELLQIRLEREYQKRKLEI